MNKSVCEEGENIYQNREYISDSWIHDMVKINFFFKETGDKPNIATGGIQLKLLPMISCIQDLVCL